MPIKIASCATLLSGMNQRHPEKNIILYASTLGLGFLFLTLPKPGFSPQEISVPLTEDGRGNSQPR